MKHLNRLVGMSMVDAACRAQRSEFVRVEDAARTVLAVALIPNAMHLLFFFYRTNACVALLFLR